MIVELSDICKSYTQGKEPVPVLHDINLSVPKGDYIAIMGPSGSGKTTLMNIIGYLDVPTSGSYKLAGTDYTDGSDDVLATVRNKNIGFVFQSFYLLPKLDALDNVALPLLYADVPVKERRRRAKEALERVGLADRIHFFPNQLSGGQCQRVAIARAIVGNPELLLADEPTGALDTASGKQIMELFRDLNDSGVSIIVITHEQAVADCANRIYRILDGRIVSEEKGTGGLLLADRNETAALYASQASDESSDTPDSQQDEPAAQECDKAQDEPAVQECDKAQDEPAVQECGAEAAEDYEDVVAEFDLTESEESAEQEAAQEVSADE